jgi:hypothetical protein
VLEANSQLDGLATALFTYAQCKQLISQPKAVGEGEVPSGYVTLAKNCVAAVFAASNLSNGSEKR